jgi:predicted phosphodiesterase
MRIAVIADIHGNLTSLEAVLADVAAVGVDRVVCLGDVAETGPQPHEVVERLRALGCPFVMGNADADLLRPIHPVPADQDGRRFAEIDAWCAAQLSAADLAFVRTFTPTVTMPLDDDASLLCFHGSPRSNTEIIVATTAEDALVPLLTGYNAAVYAGGHTHAPFLRRYKGAMLLNPGSVGLPYVSADEGIYQPPWAEYAIVDRHMGSLDIALRRVPIDTEMVRQAALRSGMPHAEWWASGWR